MNSSRIKDALVSLLMIVFGICLFIWAEKVTNTISILIGIAITLYALIGFFQYFRNKDKDNILLIWSIISLAIGIVILSNTSFLKELISFIIGIYIMLSNIIRLIDIINLKKLTNIKFTSSIVIVIIGIILGILCMIGKFMIPDVFIKFIGIILIINGLLDIINILLLNKGRK